MSTWQTDQLAGWEIQVLNVDDPAFTDDVIAEISEGTVDVYYDRRWKAARIFGEWLLEDPSFFKDRRVLVLGCGIGVETLAIAKHASEIWCNDLSPVACKWCRKQLQVNGLDTALCVGSYLDVELPEVDVVVGSFLIYNTETMNSMAALLRRLGCDAVLANGQLPFWGGFLDAFPGRTECFENTDVQICRIRGS